MKKTSQIVRKTSWILALFLFVVYPVRSFATPATVPYLDDLSAQEVNIQPAFRPTTLFYTASVDSSVQKLTIHAVAQDPKTVVDIQGSDSLQPGSNTIHIVLTSPEQMSQTYTLTVTKAGTVGTSNARLASLALKTWALTPGFSTDTTSYATDVDHNTTSLDITTTPENPNATIAISGNENFQTGANQVEIKVTSADGTHTQTYTIAVNKLPTPPKSVIPQESQKPWYVRSWLIISVAAFIGVILLATVVTLVIKKRR